MIVLERLVSKLGKLACQKPPSLASGQLHPDNK